MVLHYIPNNAERIEIASPSLSAKRLFEWYLDGGDIVPVPDRVEYTVTKPQDH